MQLFQPFRANGVHNVYLQVTFSFQIPNTSYAKMFCIEKRLMDTLFLQVATGRGNPMDLVEGGAGALYGSGAEHTGERWCFKV